jgi:hypothetical protein
LQRKLRTRRSHGKRDQLPVLERAGDFFSTAAGDDTAICHQHADTERRMRRIGELPAMREDICA